MARVITIILIALLGACGTSPDDDIANTASPSESDVSDWSSITDGLETQVLREGITFFQAVRIDPEKYTFRTHYRPDEPQTLDGWIHTLPDAMAIVNANFFAVDDTVLGLLVSDGQRFGTSYDNRGGTFYVSPSGVRLISNLQAPIPPDVSQAVQAFPMLMLDGEPAYNNATDTAISRRTVIALDRQGHVILLVTSGFGMSLYDLSQYLALSGLDLVTALNLDGGGSSMLYIAPSDSKIVSIDPVPVVLALYEK